MNMKVTQHCLFIRKSEVMKSEVMESEIMKSYCEICDLLDGLKGILETYLMKYYEHTYITVMERNTKNP